MGEDRWLAGAFEKVKEALSHRDVSTIASGSGGALEDGSIRLRVLNRIALISTEGWSVVWQDGGEPDPDMKVVLLHYLLGAPGRLDGTLISYRDVEGGSLYYSVFHQRAIAPMVNMFENDPAALDRSAIALGGARVQRGDMSFDFLFFPFLLVNISFWKGDEEVPTTGNILFDASAARALRAEDLAHLSGDFVRYLRRGKM
ncbi:MAG: hypothetical protein A3K76_03875 [Euryarchaeota archaeon RBG_13_57_23]|nr:MAG: hypothetical protein A3K76_03875 [Euryarchaeota archaeon RBG_13_57_23]